MLRNVAAPALLLLGLAACGSGSAPAPTPNVVTNRAGALNTLGEGPAFGIPGNSQGPVTSNTGQSGTMANSPTSRATIGATPTDDSNSASARGNPRAFATPTTRPTIGSSPTDESNSASARGGPGTGPITGRRPAAPTPRRGAATAADGAYMGGGMVTETPATTR